MIFRFLTLIPRVYDRMLMFLARKRFKAIGKHCSFHPLDSDFHYQNIALGDHVAIGRGARFWCLLSGISIGNHVIFGPDVSIIAGNHSFHKVGLPIDMYTNQDKRPEDDLPVRIDDDVWIGTNVTILNGVHIGRGAIIAAGAVVTKDVNPYVMGGGIPCKPISYRMSIDDIIEHEKALYPEASRYTREQLEAFRK